MRALKPASASINNTAPHIAAHIPSTRDSSAVLAACKGCTTATRFKFHCSVKALIFTCFCARYRTGINTVGAERSGSRIKLKGPAFEQRVVVMTATMIMRWFGWRWFGRGRDSFTFTHSLVPYPAFGTLGWRAMLRGWITRHAASLPLTPIVGSGRASATFRGCM